MMNSTLILTIVTFLSIFVSYLFDTKKTIKGVKKGLKMLNNMILPLIYILIFISIILYLIPESMIVDYLGPTSGVLGYFLAAFMGSITLIPGIISYPIAATLISKGALYSVVAIFMITLMMVGIITLPLEIKYFGKKAALIRNILNFCAAIIIGLLIGGFM